MVVPHELGHITDGEPEIRVSYNRAKVGAYLMSSCTGPDRLRHLAQGHAPPSRLPNPAAGISSGSTACSTPWTAPACPQSTQRPLHHNSAVGLLVVSKRLLSTRWARICPAFQRAIADQKLLSVAIELAI